MIIKNNSAGSFLNDLHPAVKLFTFICVIQMASISTDVFSFVFFSALYAGLITYSKISVTSVLNKIKPFLMILTVTFAINIIFGSGLQLSAILTLRFLLIILFSLLLTATTDPAVLVTIILYPFRGRHGKNMRVVFMVAMEFIPVFVSEAKLIGASIKEKYKGKSYKAVFRPELYIAPMAEKLASMSAKVAEDVDRGAYGAAALPQIRPWEYSLAATVFVLAVKYAS